MSRPNSEPGPGARFGRVVLLLCLFLSSVAAQLPGADPQLAGLPLSEALEQLSSQGLRVVFTTEVVRPEMVVGSEPEGDDARQRLDQVLSEHGLEVTAGAGGTLVVVRSATDLPSPPPTPIAESPQPEALPMIEEEMVVRPSRVSLLRRQPIAPLGMTRDEILALPHLSDDFYRSLSLLPGVTSTDVSAQFHVRGGRRDETQVLLDGQELYDAYHLKDYDSALSLIDSNNLGSADMTTGGYSAQYGDRMSGVLDMTTLTPTGGATGRVSLGVLAASLGGAGRFSEGRGEWLAEVRRGTIEFVNDLIGDEDPSYWDAFGKMRYQLGSRNNLGAHVLGSGDSLTFSETEGTENSKRTVTDYDSRYVWLTHQLLASDQLYADTALSYVEIDRDRNGVELDEDAAFMIRDIRASDIAALRQGWSWEASPKHLVQFGFQLRRWDTAYDYFAVRELDNPVPGAEEEETVVFEEQFEENHNSVYVSDRFRISEPLTLELGLRWDDYSQTDESRLSPRLNLAWAIGSRNVARFSWGRFDQSQRPYELQVEDGETDFHPVEQSEHYLLGFERLLHHDGARTLALRVEGYYRDIDNPRPRYENLYEPINTFPEAEPDRVRIAPERSVSEGIEIFLRGRQSERFGWFVNYSWASIEDRLTGSWVPRSYDQRHTINLDVDYRLGADWRLNVAWRYHSGWPTTPLTLEPEEDEDGELVFVPVLGELNSERLASYHRFDVRASRSWQLRGGRRLGFFVDVQNLFDRDNIAGFDVEIDDEEGEVDFETEFWAGIVPSLGVTFEF